MTNCILYLRKSDESAEADDFDSQEEICREYAAKKGYVVVDVYREAHSGKLAPTTRGVLRQAISQIKQDHAKVMVIRTFDRLARDVAQMYAILFEVEQIYHGLIEAAQEPIDRTSQTATMQLAIAAIASQMERDRIAERTEYGKRKRAEMGHLMASPHPLYGYAWADPEAGKRTSYKMDPVSGKVVKQIFDWAASGMSSRQIARTLNAQHIPSSSAYAASLRDTGRRMVGSAWPPETVRSILKNPAYAGFGVAYRFKYSLEYKNGEEVMTRSVSDKSLGLPDTTCPAIVTPEQFKLVQQRFTTNTAGRKPLDPESGLFSGHVWCGVCGRRMYVQKRIHSTYVFMCSRRSSSIFDGSEPCPGGHFCIRTHEVNRVGWDGIKQQIMHREEFEQLLRDQALTGSRDDLMSYVAATKGALKQAEDDLEKLARRLGPIDDEIVADALVRQMKLISKEVPGLREQAAAAQKQLDEYSVGDAGVDQVLRDIYGPLDEDVMDRDYDKLSLPVRRQAVQRSRIVITVFPKGWEINGEVVPRIVVTYGVKLPVATCG